MGQGTGQGRRAPAAAPRAGGLRDRLGAAPGRIAAQAGAALRGDGAESATAGGLLALFIVALVFPIYFHVGTLRLSPERVFLLLLVIPLALRLLSGKAGRLRAADLFIGLHCGWIGLSLIVNDGVARIPFAGITMVELGGGYLVGRCLVRNRVDYRIFLGAFLGTLVFLFPFAMIEFLTDRQYLQILADRIAETFVKPESSRPRMGFYRVMAGFEHPILYGLYCSIAVGHVLYLWHRALWQRLALVGLASMMVFLSLSAAPMLAVAMQLGLAAWDRISGGRWRLAMILAVVGYVVIDILSNRTPIEVIISYLTFSAETGYTRILIFQYGIESVWANPLFGIALGDWPRPPWLTDSVDNFWLLTAMRYGIPAFVFIVLGIVLGARDIMRARNVSPEILTFRIGYLISLGGVLLTLVTVHMWGAVSVFVMMLLGAGMWFADAGRLEDAAAAGPAPGASGAPSGAGAGRAMPYSRGTAQAPAPATHGRDATGRAPDPKARLPYSRGQMPLPGAADQGPDSGPDPARRPRAPYSRKPPPR
jgi:hypothetical protein